MSATFCVVTPSYNQARFIKKTIDSVLQQPVAVNYWVIDAKSNDGTVKILQIYGKRIQWLSEKDAGQADAINKGIAKLSKIKQGYFSYINSDDYYLPGAFQAVSRAFEKHPEAAWLVGDCIIVNEHGMEIQHSIRAYKSWLRAHFSPWLLHIVNPIPQPAVFIRISALKNVGEFMPSLRYVMDYEYWQRMLRHFGKPLFLHQPLAAFRVHAQSKGGVEYRPQFDEQYQVTKNFTKNSVLLFSQTLHNGVIKLAYALLK